MVALTEAIKAVIFYSSYDYDPHTLTLSAPNTERYREIRAGAI